ncbi:MAG: flagellar protein FliS [Candidatus Azotimanducaceae bacterium]
MLSLRFVLNAGSGSKLFASLFATYTTIAASLKKAKEEQDINSIETIYEALDELRTAWHSVG